MPDSFALLQPVWLGVALVALLALAPARRAGRVGAAKQDDFPNLTSDPQGASPLRPRIDSRVLAAVRLFAAIALSIWLLYEGTSAALLVLAACTLAAAGWGHARVLRMRSPRPPALSQVGIVGCRVAAWAVLLALVTQPSCRISQTHVVRPLLVALLDDSRSMELVDAPAEQSRAARANEAFRGTAASLAALDRLFDTRVMLVGDRVWPAEIWSIRAGAPITAIAGALREAALLADAADPGATILLIGDGAENALDADAVRAAASEIAARQIALFTVGVGPPPERTPAVDLHRLVLPGRIGVRERLRVPVRARVRGCANHDVTIELVWGDGPPTRAFRPVRSPDAEVVHEFETLAPAVGVQRVTARVALPAALGGAVFETSAFVEVGEQRIRVLWLDGPPRQESAFALRALRSDPQIEVAYRPMFGDGDADDVAALAGEWTAHDVVVLGALPDSALRTMSLAALARAVSRDGVGLLLAGGASQLIDNASHLAPLDETIPVSLPGSTESPPRRRISDAARFLPTAEGRAHPVLTDEAGRPIDATAWVELPPLDSPIALGPTHALAATLATDERSRPWLVVQTAGRGRSAVVAWERSWRWPLSGDKGGALHRRLWRQLIVWLANRRPHPWIVTDQPRYTAAALRGGQQRVAVRAGLTSWPDSRSGEPSAIIAPEVSLTLKQIGPSVSSASRPTTTAASSAPTDGSDLAPPRGVQLRSRGAEWAAELPADGSALDAGTYELQFEVTLAGRDFPTASAPAPQTTPDTLTVRTRFEVIDADLESQHPTANLALLRDAAELTRAHGGRYVSIEELPQLLQEMTSTDRRRRVESTSHYDCVEQRPWTLLGALAAALMLEWLMRKRLRLL